MATQNVVFTDEMDMDFVLVGTDWQVKIDGTLQRNAATGEIGLAPGAVVVVSTDAGNIINTGVDGGALLTQADIQAVETVWNGDEPSGFMTVTESGINGHTVAYSFDYTNAGFVEGVQDAVGAAILNGAGITYDDVADAISTTLGNITFGNGLDLTAGTVTVLPDPASPSTVTVSAAGVSVQANVSADANNLATLGTDNRIMVDEAAVTALATVDVCDSSGNHRFFAFP